MSRPRVLVVLGVLNLLVAVVWVAKGLTMPLYAVVPLSFLEQNNQFGTDMRPVEALYEALSHTGFLVWWVGWHLVGVLAGLVLGVGGVGLLMARGWGRKLTVGWAWYALGVACVAVWMEQLYVAPAMAAAMEQADASAGQQVVEVVFGLLVRWAYPVVLLVVLARPQVVAALDRPRESAPAARVPAGSARVAAPSAGHVTMAAAEPRVDARPTEPTNPAEPASPPASPGTRPALQTWRDDPWNDPEAT